MRYKLNRALAKVKDLLLLPGQFQTSNDDLKLLMGRSLSETIIKKNDYKSLVDLEFKVFSQFGDDGIIQYLVHNLDLRHKTFVEFGVEDYSESNTRFLLQNNNWSGFVMDGSSNHLDKLKSAPWFWKYDLNAQAVFVTKENIDNLLARAVLDWEGVDILHIDIDGNDYWVWKEIKLNPSIVIMEYNSVFGIDRAITIPYESNFYRTNTHSSNLYWGSSLKALYLLAISKNYVFIGCNSAGNNAYFIRKDKMNDRVREVSLEGGYTKSKYRESRDEQGNLTYASTKKRASIIKGLPVFDVEFNKVTSF
jgi:hypothetical protein